MNKRSIFFICVFAVLLALPVLAGQEEIVTLKLGAAAPDFDLPGVDGTNHTLSDYSKSDVLVVIFTCNHCPTAQAYEQRLIDLAADYQDKPVAIVAISPNDPQSVSLAELGYSDMSDSLEEMKLRAVERGFNFPYLYDGDDQKVSRAYGPVTTPHVFIFDQQRKLRYTGWIDDAEKIGTAKKHDTRNAIEALLAQKEVPVKTTKTRPRSQPRTTTATPTLIRTTQPSSLRMSCPTSKSPRPPTRPPCQRPAATSSSPSW
jgi:peroxiredoxin